MTTPIKSSGPKHSRLGRLARRRKRSSSIRLRVLAIALIPSTALLVTGASVAAYLASEGLHAHSFASFMKANIGPQVEYPAAVENERTISLRAVGGDPQAMAGLQAQWKLTDKAFVDISGVGLAGSGINPQAMASTFAGFRALAAQLSGLRQAVLARRASIAQVDAYYTGLANVGPTLFLQTALQAPGGAGAVDGITTLDLLSPIDLHSRVVGLGASWAERGLLSQPERLMLAQMTGAYLDELQSLVFRLTPADQAAYHRLVTGSAWQLATAGEADLARSGKLAAPATWLAAENTVSAAVLGLWADSLRQTENDAVAGADATLTRSVLLGGLALLLAVAAFAAAIVLANGLVRRLRRLRAKTLELADVTLPSLVTRIGNGELVNVESELAQLEYGGDEIGQVAEAFSAAQRTAVAAAAAEARTRGGINKVFLDIAHRSQLVVYRQLELLDVAEARQGDPEHLELLFQLDHLATRARRNAENLLILGGGQPGRKWRQAAALEDIVRSAVSETEQFARVSTVRLPEVQVLGAAVGDLIHLLAELVDNATSFSPPESAVFVRGNVVGKGVVVEVEDQGLGIEFAERERLSAALRDPPDFQSMAVAGQRHLGLFVVGQLAQRHGITVSLLESAYGGIKAIVLIPSGIVASAPAGDWPELSQAARAVSPPPRQDSGSFPVAVKPPQRTAVARAQDPVRRGRAPLPRRERLANLAPGLRLGDEAAGSEAARRPSRSAEEARSSLSAFQQGTRLGRETSGQDN